MLRWWLLIILVMVWADPALAWFCHSNKKSRSRHLGPPPLFNPFLLAPSASLVRFAAKPYIIPSNDPGHSQATQTPEPVLIEGYRFRPTREHKHPDTDGITISRTAK
jgi:hypothetical protein